MEPFVKTAKLVIGSPAFTHKDFLPVKYTCDGDNVNPPITIESIPAGAKSLTLIVDDPDALDGTFDHWVIWNIQPKEMINENSAAGTEGKNSFGNTKYQGPCPPEGKAHRYFFKVYVLDKLLDAQPGSDKKTIEKAMKDHILAEGEIIGLYHRSKYKSL